VNDKILKKTHDGFSEARFAHWQTGPLVFIEKPFFLKTSFQHATAR
jgi:hypothetical protein